jgi:hypothetical protein
MAGFLFTQERNCGVWTSKLLLSYQIHPTQTNIFPQRQQTHPHLTLFTALALLRSTTLDHRSTHVSGHLSLTPYSSSRERPLDPVRVLQCSSLAADTSVLSFMRSGDWPFFKNDLPHIMSSTIHSAVSLGLGRA